jgi:hypothetical protein
MRGECRVAHDARMDLTSHTQHVTHFADPATGWGRDQLRRDAERHRLTSNDVRRRPSWLRRRASRSPA